MSNQYRVTRRSPVVRRASAHQPAGAYELEEDESYYSPRVIPSSARRYTSVGGQVIQQGNKRLMQETSSNSLQEALRAA